MTREQTPQTGELATDPAESDSQELSDAELYGVVGGTGALVHEKVHVGTSTPPRTGGTTPVRPPRSPPTGFP